MHMEEMYEVLRFIEHGAHCRQSMDCIRGTILIRYLKENPEIGKAGLFGWFRQLCVCVDQYHRCRKQKEYRYLNPYSIVVSEEGELLLLDLESPENAFVMKQMQKHAVRNHFVKPVCEMGPGREQKADLFAYGKTIQFLLAYTEAVPALTRLEEVRLSRVIGRCMGESARGYTDISQVMKDLPAAKEREGKSAAGWRKKLLAAACAGTAACALFVMEERTGGIGFADKAQGGISAESGDLAQTAMKEAAARPALTEKEILEAAESILKNHALSKDEKEAQTAVAVGQEMELGVVRCLAGLYERLDMTDEAEDAYSRLIQIEKEEKMIEAAGIGKMELEASQEKYAQAVETGEFVLGRIKDSEEISQLVKEYKEKAEIQHVTVEDGTEENVP